MDIPCKCYAKKNSKSDKMSWKRIKKFTKEIFCQV